MKTVTRLAGVLSIVALTSASQLHGQALVSFTGGTLFGTFQSNGDTIGWSFTTDQRFVLTDLGYWDGDFATLPLTLPHPVGLWTPGGTLLADATSDSPWVGCMVTSETSLKSTSMVNGRRLV